LRIVVIAIVVAYVVADAQRNFTAASQPTNTPGSTEPSLQDYMNLGR
jgi:hypothetical protein